MKRAYALDQIAGTPGNACVKWCRYYTAITLI